MSTEPLRVNDSHCHFFSHAFLKTIAAQKFKEGDPVENASRQLGWETPPEDPSQLASQWVAELDRHSVQRAAIIASVPGDEESVGIAVRKFPNRFVGFFMLDPTQSDAAQRTRRALIELRMRAVCLFPAMQRFSMKSDNVKTVLSVLQEIPHSAAFVHCGALTIGIRKKLGLPSPFDLSLGNPLDISAIAASHPGVNFIIPHFGAGLLREALLVADVCPNIYMDTSSTNSWVRHLGIDLKQVFRRTLDVIGSQRLLFGSDSSFFPRGWNSKIFEEQLSVLREMKVPEPDIAAIMGGNFDRIFPLQS
jgi:uncharacterized protein